MFRRIHWIAAIVVICLAGLHSIARAAAEDAKKLTDNANSLVKQPVWPAILGFSGRSAATCEDSCSRDEQASEASVGSLRRMLCQRKLPQEAISNTLHRGDRGATEHFGEWSDDSL